MWCTTRFTYWSRIFNIFINDLFYILEYFILYNYDENTAFHSSDDVDELVCQL